MYGRSLYVCVCNAFIPSGLAVDRQWACALSALECRGFLSSPWCVTNNKSQEEFRFSRFIVFLLLSV